MRAVILPFFILGVSFSKKDNFLTYIILFYRCCSGLPKLPANKLPWHLRAQVASPLFPLPERSFFRLLHEYGLRYRNFHVNLKLLKSSSNYNKK